MQDFFDRRHYVWLPPKQDLALRVISAELGTLSVAISPNQLAGYCVSLTLPTAFNALSQPNSADRQALQAVITCIKAMPKKAARNVDLSEDQQAKVTLMANDLRCQPHQLLTHLIGGGLAVVQKELGNAPDRSKQAALRQKMGLGS